MAGTLNLIVLFGALVASGLWEFCRPRRRREFPALRRRLGNLGFWLLNLLIAGLFFAPDAIGRLRFEAVLGIDFPPWPISDAGISLAAGFLLLDFLRYSVHRCEHAVPFLWRFHALHHSDPDVDVTTAVRHHPIEFVCATAFYWVAVVILDIPVGVAAIYGLAVFGVAAVQHGNIRLPEVIENWLQPVLVTTDLHRIHHSISHDQANSNYGAVLSIWDRFFGTYRRIPRAQHDRIVFGVRDLPREGCLRPSAMFLTPWLIPRSATPPRRSARAIDPTARQRGRRRAGRGS